MWSNRAFWYVLAICLIVYIFSAKGHIEVMDTDFSVETAQAIVTRGQLDIPYVEKETLRAPDGRSYSKYGIGLPLYYVPWVAAGSALSRITGLSTPLPITGFHASFPLLTGFLISFANVPFAMLTLMVFAQLLRHFGMSERCVCFMVLGLGLGTLTWRYAGYDFSEGMQMGLLTLAVYGVIRRTPGAILAGGAAFAWLVLVKTLYVAFFPVLACYLMTREEEWQRRIRSVTLFTIPFVLACGLDAWLNFLRFAHPFESGYGSEARMFYPAHLWRTIPQLLFSFDKGLFIFSPLLLLGVFGWRKFFRQYGPESILCGALAAENLILAAAWHSWEGGWAWGPRLLVPVIPLWLLPVAFFYDRWRARKRLWVLASVAFASILAQVPGVLVDDWEINDIKQEQLTPAEREFAPSDMATAVLLLGHKLVSRNEVYRTSELHVPGNREIDMTAHRSLRGLNLWTEHASAQLNRPGLRWLPILGLTIAAYLAFAAGRSLRDEFPVPPGGD